MTARTLVRYEDVPEELKHLLREEGYEEVYEGDEVYLEQTFSLPEVVNLTPHAIKIVGVGEIPPAGLIARVSMRTMHAGTIGEIPTSRTEYGAVEGLPEETRGVYFIVSQLLKTACPNRHDLLYPAELVRDKEGNIIGCKSLGV